MYRNLRRLEDQTFDLVIIGGGIFGAAVGWDGVGRGLSVALIEQADFGNAASRAAYTYFDGGMASIHGVARFCARTAARTRRTLISLAPHLVKPMPLVLPIYGRGRSRHARLQLAMALQHAVTFDRSRGIIDRARRLPAMVFQTRKDTLGHYPGLYERGLGGAVLLHDAHVANPARLVLAHVLSAARAGAVVANHVQATDLLRHRNRVLGVIARDRITNTPIEIRGEVVLNAAGSQADAILSRVPGLGIDPAPAWTRDAWLQIDRPLIEDGPALAAPMRGFAARPDRRHILIVPGNGQTFIGPWRIPVAGEGADGDRSIGMLGSFLAEINATLPDLRLAPPDVAIWDAGPPEIAPAEGASVLRGAVDRARLIDHGLAHGLDGLLTLLGDRFVNGPGVAPRAVDAVLAKLGRGASAARAPASPVFGGAIADFESLVARAAREAPRPIDTASIRALVDNHGTEYVRVYDAIRDEPGLARRVGNTTVLEAEIAHAIRSEMAITLADVVLRRTDLAGLRHPGTETLLAAGRAMQSVCGWGPARLRAELAGVEAELAARRIEPAMAGARRISA